MRVELRRFLTTDLGIAPTIERNFKARVTQVSLPVYFLKDKEGQLSGGLRVGWRSDTHALETTLFVGAVPNLF